MDIPNTEKAVFIGVIKQNDDERKIYEYLEELEFLAETAGAIGDKQFVQKVDKPDKATYIRSGKLQEIAEYCECNEIEYVIFDDVNYINRGWINRNNILVNGQAHLFSLSLRDASQNKLINEIEIVDDFQKLRKTIEINYKKATCYYETMALLDDIFGYEDRNLARFIGNSFEIVKKYLDISCKFVYSSEIEKDSSLKSSNKILDICKRQGASYYINAIGGQELYDKATFAEHGIVLNFLQPELRPYKQHKNEFVPGLSMIDVLMFNSKEEIKHLLNAYTLI